jgi:hypothetical protein
MVLSIIFPEDKHKILLIIDLNKKKGKKGERGEFYF